MRNDEFFMREALRLASKAAKKGEVPVGAVVVADGKIIGKGYNKREKSKNALLHAEMIAIDKACRKKGGWRLFGTTLYVSLEPCPMCAGAAMNARIDKIVYGAKDEKFGAIESVVSLYEHSFNHKPETVGGVLEEESVALLKSFFKSLRERNKK